MCTKCIPHILAEHTVHTTHHPLAPRRRVKIPHSIWTLPTSRSVQLIKIQKFGRNFLWSYDEVGDQNVFTERLWLMRAADRPAFGCRWALLHCHAVAMAASGGCKTNSLACLSICWRRQTDRHIPVFILGLFNDTLWSTYVTTTEGEEDLPEATQRKSTLEFFEAPFQPESAQTDSDRRGRWAQARTRDPAELTKAAPNFLKKHQLHYAIC